MCCRYCRCPPQPALFMRYKDQRQNSRFLCTCESLLHKTFFSLPFERVSSSRMSATKLLQFSDSMSNSIWHSLNGWEKSSQQWRKMKRILKENLSAMLHSKRIRSTIKMWWSRWIGFFFFPCVVNAIKINQKDFFHIDEARREHKERN